MGEDTSTEIWKFQRNLAAITLHMEGSDATRNPISIVQFNEQGAVTCQSWSCLDNCKSAAILRAGFGPSTSITASGDILIPMQLNATSHWDGKVEPACRMGHHARDMRKLKKWSSLDAHPIYVKDDTYYMEAADMLATCMEERCCTIPMIPTPPVTCSITTDHFGEDMATYTYT